jgi:hypothetical protein
MWALHDTGFTKSASTLEQGKKKLTTSEQEIQLGDSTTFLDTRPSANEEAIIPAPIKPTERDFDEHE